MLEPFYRRVESEYRFLQIVLNSTAKKLQENEPIFDADWSEVRAAKNALINKMEEDINLN